MSYYVVIASLFGKTLDKENIHVHDSSFCQERVLQREPAASALSDESGMSRKIYRSTPRKHLTVM